MTHLPSGESTENFIGALPSQPKSIKNTFDFVRSIASGVPFLVNFELTPPSNKSSENEALPVNVDIELNL